MGGLVRCVACGEVQWNLRFRADADSEPECRFCGEELRAERRRFSRVRPERSERPAEPGPPATPLPGGAATP